MDTIFLLGDQGRNNFLRKLMDYFGCTYICMWSYLPPPTNCLLFWDGQFQEEINQASSSSSSPPTSPARRLFDEYRQNPFFVIINDHVPGSTFINRRPYMEVKEMELQRMAHVDVQRLFYQEARVKIAAFMGCRSGEIEVGWSNVPQINIQNEMRNWLHEDFSRQSQSPIRELSQQIDPNRPSSSSSSLRSLSMDSPDSCSLLFNVPTTSHLQEPQQEALTSSNNPIPQAIQTLQPLILPNTNTSPLHEVIQSLPAIPSTTNPLQQVIQSLATRSNTPYQQPPLPSFLLTRERENAAMTSAILAVLTSSSFPSSSTTSTRNLLQVDEPVSQETHAFKRFTPQLAPRAGDTRRRTSMFRKAITYYKRLSISRREHLLAANRPTSTQLHHMISERRRREKINESLQALRSLLPPDPKKDKASVLARTREYLTTLKAQVTELSRTKEQLEAQLSRVREAVEELNESSGEKVAVRVIHLPESTSEQRGIDVQISLSGEYPITDMLIRVLEFLKLDKNVNLVSMEGSTFVTENSSINRVILRLKIEGNDWDESAFQEALKRIVTDLAH